ncbi:hypothetical protein HMPREF3042_06035 [Corynebacterium sp. HMSC074C05]|nr:hypothetical protein HMPREF3042_06035 [Corynebacterium sp. HMSC074C05]
MLQKDGFRFTRMHLLHTERLLVKRKPSWLFYGVPWQLSDCRQQNFGAVQIVPRKMWIRWLIMHISLMARG